MQKFMKKATRRYGSVNCVVTDPSLSYSVRTKYLGCLDMLFTKWWAHNWLENWKLPFWRCERAMWRSRLICGLQKFASVHASFHDHFNSERFLLRWNFCKIKIWRSSYRVTSSYSTSEHMLLRLLILKFVSLIVPISFFNII